MVLRSNCNVARGMAAILAVCVVGHGVTVRAIPPVQRDSIFTRPLALSESYVEPGTVLPLPRRLNRPIAVAQAGTGGDNCNQATPNAVSVPGTISVFGNNSTATGPDDCPGFNLGTIWWEAFTITQCADVEISFCGSTPLIPSNWVFVTASCSVDGSSCTGLRGATSANRTVCADQNVWMFIPNLPAGTYYYPIISDTASDYQMNITTFECSGACCNPSAATCIEDVTEPNCSGVGEQWFPNQTCVTSGCQGACCNPQNSNCVDNVFSSQCQGAGDQFLFGQRCCDVECRDPLGPEFDASGVSLMSNVPLSDFAGAPSSANEMWGYVSPSGREYAIMGLECAFGIIEVTNPLNPVIVAEVAGSCSIWRDTAIFGQFAYGVVDQVSDGLYIMDLTNIDFGIVNTTVVNLPMGAELFERAHNAIVNPDSGFLYLGIPNTNGGAGLAVIDVGTDPANPVFVDHWTDDTDFVRCHDMHVINYTSGPNAGKEIAFCFGEGRGLVIADVTDKSNMFTISKLVYPNTTYTHQGWVDDARHFLYIGDELDEENDPDVDQTTTYVIDVADLTNPTLHTTILSDTCAIDHNLHVKGSILYESNYTSGLRIYNVSDVNNITQVGFFDTHPESNAANFEGSWGNYPFLPSGNILVSDRQRGLFVLNARLATGVGACCDSLGQTCVENVQPADCSFTFTLGSTCAEVGCTACAPPAQPVSTLVDTGSGTGNRTLVLETDAADAGLSQAIRVVFTNLDPPYDIWNGEELWVQAPSARCENSGFALPPCPGSEFWAAPLGCAPFYTDWSLFAGRIHVHHEGVIPRSLYKVDVINDGCDRTNNANFSSPLNVATSKYGDVGTFFSGVDWPPPDGGVDVIADTVAVLAKFSNLPGAPISSRADLEPRSIDWKINITDVIETINGFGGFPYPNVPSVVDPCP